MTYHDDFTLSAALLEQLSTQGLGALPDLFPVLLNAAMQIERQKHLSAAPHERTRSARTMTQVREVNEQGAVAIQIMNVLRYATQTHQVVLCLGRYYVVRWW